MACKERVPEYRNVRLDHGALFTQFYVEIVVVGMDTNVDREVRSLARRCKGKPMGSGFYFPTSRRDYEFQFKDTCQAYDFTVAVHESEILKPVLAEVTKTQSVTTKLMVTRRKRKTRKKGK